MKKIILFLALFCAAVSANAQTAIETPKFLDNWYVGVNGGATTNLDFNKVLLVPFLARTSVQYSEHS